MSDSTPPFPLLELPAGVDNLVVSFVASGDGGLRHLLNLRSVCSTTQLWVDKLPKAQADLLFSRAHVKIDRDLKTIRRFLQSPPRFGVYALCLEVEDLCHLASMEEDNAWREFCSFWNSKLEQLELRGKSNLCVSLNERLFGLLESPNLRSLQFLTDLLATESSSLPACFHKIRELRMKKIYDHRERHGLLSRLYSQLEKNSNLRVFDVSLIHSDQYESFTKFVDLKKSNTQLKITFDITAACVIKCALDPHSSSYLSCREVLHKFLRSIVGSSSEIRLKIWELQEFDEFVTALFPRGDRLGLLAKVKTTFKWKAKEGDLSLLENLPRLQRLERLKTKDSSVDYNQLTFSPSLKYLGFAKGFPAVRNLPESLTFLELHEHASDVDSLVSSLNLLSIRCPHLHSLRIKWELMEPQTRVLNFDRSVEFPQLRKLVFEGKLTQCEVEDHRAALTNGFDWEKLELRFLELKFWRCPVVDEDILKRLCEGPSAQSLLRVEVPNESVTPEGLPLLEKLRSSAVSNWKRREEKKGRGGWMIL